MKLIYNKTKALINCSIILTAIFYHGCAMYYSRILTREEIFSNPSQLSWVQLIDSSEVSFAGGVTIKNQSRGIKGRTSDGTEIIILGEKIKELQVAFPDAVRFDKDHVTQLKEIHPKNNLSVRPDKEGFTYDAVTEILSCRTDDGKMFSFSAPSITKFFTELPDTVSIERFFADTTLVVKRVLMKPAYMLVSFDDQGGQAMPEQEIIMGYMSSGELVTIPTDQIVYFMKNEGSVAGIAGNVGIVIGIIAVVSIIDCMVSGRCDPDTKLTIPKK